MILEFDNSIFLSVSMSLTAFPCMTPRSPVIYNPNIYQNLVYTHFASHHDSWRFLCLPSEWVAMKAFNKKFLYNSCTFKRLSGSQVGNDLLFPLFILQEMVLLDGSKLVTCFERTKSVLLWNHPRIIQSKNAPLINLKSDIFKRSLIFSDDT